MKPLLAATIKDLKALRFPLLVSPKLDGVRALVINGKVMSRNMKKIPSPEVQLRFRALEGMDGELIVGSPNAFDCYRKTVSHVMSENKPGGVQFHIFDDWRLTSIPFVDRFATLKERRFCLVVPHGRVDNLEQLLHFEETHIRLGFEGTMLRSLEGKYKQGRSTMAEGILMKLKRFKDDEAKVIGFEELMRNENPATVGELGQTVRSSHKENLRKGNTLGALVCEWKGQQFSIGTGFDDYTRDQIWNHKSRYLNQMVKFKYLEVGVKDLPRHPVFLGWRQGD